MKKFMIYFNGYAEYIADSEEEARTMFKNDYFNGETMDIYGIMEGEVEDD